AVHYRLSRRIAGGDILPDVRGVVACRVGPLDGRGAVGAVVTDVSGGRHIEGVTAGRGVQLGRPGIGGQSRGGTCLVDEDEDLVLQLLEGLRRRRLGARRGRQQAQRKGRDGRAEQNTASCVHGARIPFAVSSYVVTGRCPAVQRRAAGAIVCLTRYRTA